MRAYYILLLLALALTGCESLEEKPFSFLSPENIYQNEDDVDKAILGVYQTLNFNGVNDLWYTLTTSGPSENVTVRLKQGAQGRMASVDFNETNPHGAFWSEFYAGINRANTVIALTPNVGLEAAVQEAKIAEARYLRAFFYFQLVRMFGGVPLQLEPTADFSDEAVKKPRTTIEEVYAVIIEDLMDAAAKLPESWPAADYGRATSGAANALLGEAYLTMAGRPLQQTARYADAIAALEKVEGKYALLENYADVFAIDNEQNTETIFSRINISNIFGSGTVLTFFAGAPNTPFAFNGGQYQLAFNEVLYDKFDSTDLRRDVTFLYTYINDKGQQVTYNSPENPAGLQFGGPKAPNGIPLGKLKDPSNTLNPFGHGNDLIFLRYADVLLMLAEAQNENGDAAAALPYLNQIRQRARLADLTETNPATLRELIKDERKKELAAEFTEYYDLQRWGDLEASMAINPDSELLGVTYDPKYELLPIPRGVLETNEKLIQNPGY